MAIESVEANAGSGGATFAVDTITGDVQVPYVKLMSGADAAEDLIGGDATNGLDVDVTRVQGSVAVTNAGLTELAAAINASSQMDVNIAASNATVTVAGTVDLGATDNAVLDAIAASVAAIDTDATTIIGHLDGVETLLGTIDADTSALAGAVSGSEMQVDVVGALPAGTNAIGKLAANSGVDIGDVDVTSIAAGTNTIGGVTPRPETANGLSIFRSIDLDETEEEVKGSAGQVYAMWVTNTATATRFIKFYNATAANVTVGTTTPVITIAIPGNSSDDISGHFAAGGFGIAFGTAITVAATTGVADNDTGAPGANEVIVNIFYK